MPERAGEIKHSYVFVEKITKLGFNPVYSLEMRLEIMIEFWSN